MSTPDLTASILQELRDEKGLYLPAKPEGDIPTLPIDITDLSDEDLMVLYADFTAWSDYTASQLAIAAGEEREYNRIHELEKAKALVMGGTKSVTHSKALAEEGAEAEGSTAVRAYAVRKIMESLYANMERDAALLSRELSRRLGEKNSSPTRRKRWMTP